MHSRLKTLLVTQRFLPLFITQFLQAFNDNFFRNALLILITYKITTSGSSPETLSAFLSAIFIAPFFLFSATAGKIADRFEKTMLIRIIKVLEISAMCCAAIGFSTHSLWILMFTLFLLGIHSALFGPIKYSIIPQHLKSDELISGNALLEASTFLSILMGTLLGGVLIALPYGEILVSMVGIIVAVAGFFTSFLIPLAPSYQTDIQFSANIWNDTNTILEEGKQNTEIFAAIIAISWFWAVGSIFLTEFASFTKVVLNAVPQVVTVFLGCFSIGIAVGALLSERIQNGEVNAKYVPLGIFAMTLFILDFYFASPGASAVHSATPVSLLSFISSFQGWRVMFDVFMISVSSGIYVVPLYAIIQSLAKDSHRSRIIAANNIVNSLFMVVASAVVMLLFTFSLTIPQIFLIIGLLNLGMAFYVCRLLPDAVLKSFLSWILRALYQVKVTGIENYRAAGKRTVIIANHVSFLDGLLLAAFLPDKMIYAVDYQISEIKWIKPFLKLVNAFAVDPLRPMLTKSLIKEIKADNRCIIFPEGRITNTGALMKIYEGPGMIADKADAQLLPIRIDGAQYSPFSRLRGKVRKQWFPKITITILPPTKFKVPDELKGRKRRLFISRQLYDLMTDLIVDTSDFQKTLFQALLDASEIHGQKRVVLDDIQHKPITYKRLIQGSFVLGHHLAAYSKPKEYVGIFLPNMVATALSFFALQAYGRIPVMLNISAGSQNVLTACDTALIKTVISSQQFIERAKLQKIITALVQAGIHIIYLEDVKTSLSRWSKLTGYLYSKVANFSYRHLNPTVTPEQAATVLFTSGSEGTPKGVVLSHRNILANGTQLSSRVDYTSQDSVFNCMPLFHSFGLTGGLIVPLMHGVKVFLYPSPLHYRVISELVYETNSTVFFGTDTFLNGYARVAHPYDFYSVRYIFAGAEKLKAETSRLWSEKFGTRVFEGYGATETAPILSTNTPMQNKPGTVGRFLPKIHYHLQAVPGLDVGGRLFVSGPNIMLGYLKRENPGEIIQPTDGWYDTGDIVSVDDEGYVTLLDRARRFAKVGGELIALSAVEIAVRKLWPNHLHAVIAIPDERRGEQLILFTEFMNAERKMIIDYFREQGIAEIYIPRQIIPIETIPVLPTGKTDYVTLKDMISEKPMV